MDQKSGKAVLVHKNDSTVLRPKRPEAGTFFHYSFLLIYSSLFPTSPLICPLQGSGNNYNTFTFTKVICNVIYDI